jgi:hypothetical protein
MHMITLIAMLRVILMRIRTGMMTGLSTLMMPITATAIITMTIITTMVITITAMMSTITTITSIVMIITIMTMRIRAAPGTTTPTSTLTISQFTNTNSKMRLSSLRPGFWPRTMRSRLETGLGLPAAKSLR